MAKTQPEDPGTELIVFEQQELIDMPALMTEYDAFLDKATKSLAALGGVKDNESSELYATFIERCKLRKQEFNERRMPFTRKINSMVSLFTTREKEWDRLAALAQDERDKFARAELKRTRDLQAAEDKRIAEEQAKIKLEGRIREYCRQRLSEMLDNVRTGCGDLVQKVTKGNFETTKLKLSGDPKWKPAHDTFIYELPPWITKEGEDHFKSIVNGEIEQLKADYIAESKTIMQNSITILETALTNKEEAQNLLEADAQRSQEHQQQQNTELQKELDAQQAIVALDKEVIDAPKVRVKMRVDILDNVGWLHLISWWYKHDPEAKTKDLSKKTFLQCKTFCEKHCYDTGEFMEHESLQWIEDVKAK